MANQSTQEIMELPAEARYSYLIYQVIAHNQIHLVCDEEGEFALVEYDGDRVLPVWPSQELAALVLQTQWPEYFVATVPLDEFLDWLEDLEKDSIEVAGFPNAELNAVIAHPQEIKSHILTSNQKDSPEDKEVE